MSTNGLLISTLPYASYKIRYSCTKSLFDSKCIENNPNSHVDLTFKALDDASRAGDHLVALESAYDHHKFTDGHQGVRRGITRDNSLQTMPDISEYSRKLSSQSLAAHEQSLLSQHKEVQLTLSMDALMFQHNKTCPFIEAANIYCKSFEHSCRRASLDSTSGNADDEEDNTQIQ